MEDRLQPQVHDRRRRWRALANRRPGAAEGRWTQQDDGGGAGEGETGSQGSRIEPPEHRPPRARLPRQSAGGDLTTRCPERDHRSIPWRPSPRSSRPTCIVSSRRSSSSSRLPETAFVRTEARHARTVGPHLRHVLDHYSALLAGLPDFRVDYDARARDSHLESDPRSRRRPAARDPRRAGPGRGGPPGAADPDPPRVAAAPKPSSGVIRRCAANCSSCSRIPCTTSP